MKHTHCADGAGRADHDFYPSPAHAADHLIRHSRVKLGNSLLDAGCGKGALMRPFIKAGVPIQGIDLVDRGGVDDIKDKVTFGVDFLAMQSLPEGTDSIIMNPPFDKAVFLDFVKHGHDLLPDDGAMTVLMRLQSFAALRMAWMLPRTVQLMFMGRLKMLPDGDVRLDKGFTGAHEFVFVTMTKHENQTGPILVRVPKQRRVTHRSQLVFSI